MDHGAHKVLESATFRALHAQNFSRSSSQASLVLTDLLSRYLTLLSTTCAKYAQHAGRTRLMPLDAFSALDELGVNIDELKDYYMTEGYEMNRYSIPSAHLNEFKTQLMDGLKQETDDVIPLFYGRLDAQELEMEDEEEDRVDFEDDEGFSMMDTDIDVLGASAPFIRKGDKPPLPLLPPSPISNPTSPSSRKRARTADWRPPPHVPEFLPPFPQPELPEPSRPASPTSPHIPQLQLEPLKIENQQSQLVTSSDYLSQVPYAESTLSAIPEWHLPQLPSADRDHDPPKRATRLPTPQTEPSFIKAYHHILTHPPPPNHSINPSRHKVAMALLLQMQTSPRWDLPDTLFGSVTPCPPRAPPIVPTHPIPIAKASVTDGKLPKVEDKELKLPGAQPRAVCTTERMAHLINQQPSRIPDLARRVLPPSILARTSRLMHPPVLMRGTQKLVYGNGSPAPWNSGPPVLPNALVNGKSKEKDKDASLPNGKESESPIKPVLPDARMFATWDSEKKDYRAPLNVPLRGRPRVGSIQAGTSGVTLSLSRGKRKDSAY